MVSTSGSSGIVQNGRGSGPRGAIVCCAAEYTLHSLAFRHIRALAADTGRTAQQRRKSNLAHFRRFAIAVAISGAVAASLAHGHPGPGPRPRSNAWRRDRPATPTAARTDSAPDAGLPPELMYRLLLGDVALQRGEPALAARAYLEAARETRDPTLARRATEIAVGARARGRFRSNRRAFGAKSIPPAAAAEAADRGACGQRRQQGIRQPGRRQRPQGGARAGARRGGRARPPALGEAFLQLNRLLAYEPDKQATLRLVESVAQPYPDLAEARFAVALAAFNTGLNDLSTSATALREVDRALILKPGWERAAMLKAEILGKRSPAEAIAYLDRLHRRRIRIRRPRRARSRSSTSSRSAMPKRARSSSASGPRTRPTATTSSRSPRSPCR